MRVRRGVSLRRLCNDRRLSRSVRHNALLGWTVARCHVTNARAVALTLIIREFVESGRSIAHHSLFSDVRGMATASLGAPERKHPRGTQGHRGTNRMVFVVR